MEHHIDEHESNHISDNNSTFSQDVINNILQQMQMDAQGAAGQDNALTPAQPRELAPTDEDNIPRQEAPSDPNVLEVPSIFDAIQDRGRQ